MKTNLLCETLRVISVVTGPISILDAAASIKWAKICYSWGFDESESREIVLPPNHSMEDAMYFLSQLNFGYYKEGSQEVAGTIILRNGAWLTRHFGNDREWWRIHQCPKWK